MKKALKRSLMIAGAAALFAGCAGPVIEDVDAGTVNTISTDFNANDLQTTVETMVQSLLTSPATVEITKGKRPVLLVSKLANKTSQHLDTTNITDSIRTQLIRSGKFRFIDRTSDDAAIKEIKTQLDSGLVDPGTAKSFGKQIGSDYILYGTITEMQTRSDRERDFFYKITLNLKDLETGILEWADEQKIRRTSKKRRFGF